MDSELDLTLDRLFRETGKVKSSSFFENDIIVPSNFFKQRGIISRSLPLLTNISDTLIELRNNNYIKNIDINHSGEIDINFESKNHTCDCCGRKYVGYDLYTICDRCSIRLKDDILNSRVLFEDDSSTRNMR